MPDDTTPEQPGNAPSDAGGENAGPSEPWDSATQSTPASTPDDATQTLAANATPPVGTPATASAGTPAETAPGTDGPGPRAGGSPQRAWLIAVVAAAVLLVGAGIAWAVTAGTKKSSPTAAPNIPNTPGATPTTVGALCPLTGVPASGNSVPQRPALAVKVDNYPQARPQSGLDQADIVFEEPVEGGITRLVAVFQCQSPALIGPIRSARAVDAPILDQLSRPILIHAGGINPVLALLQNANLIDDNVFFHGAIVKSIPGRYAPYDTYVAAAAAWGLNPSDTKPPAALFTYSSTSPAGTPVTSVHIPFTGTNNTLWTWNAASGHWLLSYSGKPATVANGGQIATTNIVVQTVHVTYGPWLENNVGGLEVQSQMTGSGPLTVLRNGVAITGTWHRATLNDPTTLTASDGSSIALQPGQTWVEMVPSTVPVTTTSPTVPPTTHP
jgi:Protein of unknown function (DUF3048) N-terminal domain/Protein of unknown function (DUF3048) C-terminal domain